jgi:hypothetical protein
VRNQPARMRRIATDDHISRLRACAPRACPDSSYEDRDPALDLTQAVEGGILLGDLGYRGPQFADLLAGQAEMLIITRTDVPDKRALHSSIRQQIETLFSQLWHGFIDRIFSRSWNGLWNTIRLKLLSFNLRHAGILSADQLNTEVY